MAEIKKYQYGVKWKTVILGILFFGIMAAFSCFMALTEKRGLIIGHLIRLSGSGARIFYGIMCGVCLAFVLACVAAIWIKLNNKRSIIIDDLSILIPPGGFVLKTDHILFSSLNNIEEYQVRGIRMLILSHENKKRTLTSSMLKPEDYNEIRAILFAKRNSKK